ncbi:MAG: UDP-3-O-acyl-N-acetylglucosamine deacetylase, partial [Rhodospirillaceae bacterium]
MAGEVIKKTTDATKQNTVTKQKTLKTPIGCTGIALHSGRKVTLNLVPAEANAGIRVRRTDLFNGASEIAVNWRNVVDTRLATTVGNDYGTRVGTIEHLMAALAGCGIDNVVIEVDGPEIPVMDGSAAPFVFLVECAGTVEQDAPRRAIRILRPVRVGDAKRSISVLPAADFSLDFEIDFDSAAIDRQEYSFENFEGDFKAEIARARTFGFEQEVEAL